MTDILNSIIERLKEYTEGIPENEKAKIYITEHGDFTKQEIYEKMKDGPDPNDANSFREEFFRGITKHYNLQVIQFHVSGYVMSEKDRERAIFCAVSAYFDGLAMNTELIRSARQHT